MSFFMKCERLRSLFCFIGSFIFCCWWNVYNDRVHFRFKYCKNKKRKGLLLNFILGQAKMAMLYRRHKILYDKNGQVELVFNGLIKASVWHDFILYLSMKEVGKFEDIWSVEDLLCWVEIMYCFFFLLRILYNQIRCFVWHVRNVKIFCIKVFFK